jgi:hypothetical protein
MKMCCEDAFGRKEKEGKEKGENFISANGARTEKR